MQTNEAIAPSSDKRRIEILLLALKPLNDLRGSIPLPYALTFLAVAREEGKAIGIYASEMDLSRFMMSRYVQCLGDRGRYGTPGLGLVTVKRTRGFRTKTEVFLTAKGRAVACASVSESKTPPLNRAAILLSLTANRSSICIASLASRASY